MTAQNRSRTRLRGRSDLPLGSRVPADDFRDTVFGVTGVNDWSARDTQAWEYVPLGPNLGKSFATSISAWVDPLADLAPARIELPPRNHLCCPTSKAPSAWHITSTWCE